MMAPVRAETTDNTKRQNMNNNSSLDSLETVNEIVNELRSELTRLQNGFIRLAKEIDGVEQFPINVAKLNVDAFDDLWKARLVLDTLAAEARFQADVIRETAEMRDAFHKALYGSDTYMSPAEIDERAANRARINVSIRWGRKY